MRRIAEESTIEYMDGVKKQFVFVWFILQSVILGFQRFKVKQFNKTL